jgi:hypothetical protein
MKRYALFHIEEELYLNEYPDNAYELDSNVFLFTKGELEYIFENKYDVDDWDEETVSLDDGTECHKSEFELVEYRISEMKRTNFNEFNFD